MGKQISIFLKNESLAMCNQTIVLLLLATREQYQSNRIISLLINGKFIYMRQYLLVCNRLKSRKPV